EEHREVVLHRHFRVGHDLLEIDTALGQRRARGVRVAGRSEAAALAVEELRPVGTIVAPAGVVAEPEAIGDDRRGDGAGVADRRAAARRGLLAAGPGEGRRTGVRGVALSHLPALVSALTAGHASPRWGDAAWWGDPSRRSDPGRGVSGGQSARRRRARTGL